MDGGMFFGICLGSLVVGMLLRIVHSLGDSKATVDEVAEKMVGFGEGIRLSEAREIELIESSKLVREGMARLEGIIEKTSAQIQVIGDRLVAKPAEDYCDLLRKVPMKLTVKESANDTPCPHFEELLRSPITFTLSDGDGNVVSEYAARPGDDPVFVNSGGPGLAFCAAEPDDEEEFEEMDDEDEDPEYDDEDSEELGGEATADEETISIRSLREELSKANERNDELVETLTKLSRDKAEAIRDRDTYWENWKAHQERADHFEKEYNHLLAEKNSTPVVTYHPEPVPIDPEKLQEIMDVVNRESGKIQVMPRPDQEIIDTLRDENHKLLVRIEILEHQSRHAEYELTEEREKNKKLEERAKQWEHVVGQPDAAIVIHDPKFAAMEKELKQLLADKNLTDAQIKTLAREGSAAVAYREQIMEMSRELQALAQERDDLAGKLKVAPCATLFDYPNVEQIPIPPTRIEPYIGKPLERYKWDVEKEGFVVIGSEQEQ